MSEELSKDVPFGWVGAYQLMVKDDCMLNLSGRGQACTEPEIRKREIRRIQDTSSDLEAADGNERVVILAGIQPKLCVECHIAERHRSRWPGVGLMPKDNVGSVSAVEYLRKNYRDRMKSLARMPRRGSR